MRDYCWAWHSALDLRDTSMQKYESRLRARIVPYWGDRAVGDITAWEYDAWKKSLQAAVARGELAQNYVDQLLGLFGMLMTDAVVKYKLRTESPVVKQVRRGKYEKKHREKKRPMTMDVVYRLAVNAHTVWGYTGWTYIWTLAFTGMRPPGETWGLGREYASPNWPATEPDADLREEALDRYKDMPALRVQWQVQQIRGKGRMLVGPKYDSHRTLVVPPFLHEMHMALLASHDCRWVFPSSEGKQMNTQWSRYYWSPIRDGAEARPAQYGWPARAKIPAVPEMAGKRIYLLRHAHREWLDEDGHSEVAIETRMGHEVAGVKGLYSNLTPKMESGIAESLQERWESFMDPKCGRWRPDFPSVSQ
jgi:hypothetical protein